MLEAATIADGKKEALRTQEYHPDLLTVRTEASNLLSRPEALVSAVDKHLRLGAFEEPHHDAGYEMSEREGNTLMLSDVRRLAYMPLSVREQLSLSGKTPGVHSRIIPFLEVTDVEELQHDPFFQRTVSVDDIHPSQDPSASFDDRNVIQVEPGPRGRMIELPGDRWSLGHHLGPRFSQRACCQQFLGKLLAGSLEPFLIDGQLSMTVVNHKQMDEDVAAVYCMARYLRDKLQEAGGNMRRTRMEFAPETRAASFAEAEGKMDVEMGGADLPPQMRRNLKEIFWPLCMIKKNFLSLSASSLQDVLEEIYRRFIAYMDGYESAYPLQEGSVLLERDGWTHVPFAEPDARPSTRRLSKAKLCIFNGADIASKAARPRRIMTVANWQPASKISMDRLYQFLNIAEGARLRDPSASVDDITREIYEAANAKEPVQVPYILWGGQEAGGCIPYGSAFVDEKEFAVIGNCAVACAARK